LNKFKEKVLFYGTPGFAVESLKGLMEGGFNIIGVVTAPDRRAGRGMRVKYSDVKDYALDNRIPVFQPTNLKSEEFQNQLKELDPDVQVVIAFRMLPVKVWDFPRLGTYNVHASLLPSYRGAAPINWALYNGEKETGVTTFKLKHEIDTGDIALQASIAISDTDNFESLHDKLALLGSQTIIETLKQLFEGSIKLLPQDFDKGNYPKAPKINKADLFLDLDQKASKAYNAIRAFSPYPGARISYNDRLVKIISALPDFVPHKKSDKTIYNMENELYLRCSDKSLQITKAQFEGKKAMTAAEIINGRLI